MITAIAALITALVGLAAFVVGNQQNKQESPPESPKSPSSTPRRSNNAAPSQPAQASDFQLAWHGALLFDNDGIDLDTDPPTRIAADHTDSGGFDIYASGGVGESYGTSTAPWRDKRDPSPEDCASQLKLYSATIDSLDVGRRICIHTSQGRIGLMKILKQEGYLVWKVELTVWRQSS